MRWKKLLLLALGTALASYFLVLPITQQLFKDPWPMPGSIAMGLTAGLVEIFINRIFKDKS